RIRQLEGEIQSLREKLAERGATVERLQRQADMTRTGVQHRLRNLLANVRSIASHTAEHAHDVGEFIAHFDGRLGALARCESMLNRGADMRADLEELVREEFLAHAVDSRANILIEGANVRLNTRTAEAMALAIHELTSNAVKFGALSH